jgi:hypothetical protein
MSSIAGNLYTREFSSWPSGYTNDTWPEGSFVRLNGRGRRAYPGIRTKMTGTLTYVEVVQTNANRYLVAVVYWGYRNSPGVYPVYYLERVEVEGRTINGNVGGRSYAARRRSAL